MCRTLDFSELVQMYVFSAWIETSYMCTFHRILSTSANTTLTREWNIGVGDIGFFRIKDKCPISNYFRKLNVVLNPISNLFLLERFWNKNFIFIRRLYKCPIYLKLFRSKVARFASKFGDPLRCWRSILQLNSG